MTYMSSCLRELVTITREVKLKGFVCFVKKGKDLPLPEELYEQAYGESQKLPPLIKCQKIFLMYLFPLKFMMTVTDVVSFMPAIWHQELLKRASTDCPRHCKNVQS